MASLINELGCKTYRPVELWKALPVPNKLLKLFLNSPSVMRVTVDNNSGRSIARSLKFIQTLTIHGMGL